MEMPRNLGVLINTKGRRQTSDRRETLEYMQLALRRGRGRRVPIHDAWRREHNIWARGWGVRITIRIRGWRIVPCIGARWRWRVGCTRKGLGRVLGKRRRVGCLFSPRRGSRLFLVPAHEIFPSGVGVVLRWRGEGDKYLLQATRDMMDQSRGLSNKGKMRVRGRKEDGLPRLWSFGISRSRRRSDSACDGAPPQFRANWLISRQQRSRCNRFLEKMSCPKRCGGGVPRAMMMWFGGMG